MKTKTSLGQRLAAFMLALIMVLGMVPANPSMAAEEAQLGAVEAITEGVTVVDGSSAKVAASFAGYLQQQDDAWKVGIKMTAPAGMTDEQLQTATYKNGSSEKTFFQDMVSAEDARYVTLWAQVTMDAIRQANLADGTIVSTWTFNWDGQGAVDQTVTLTIDTAKTILLDADSVQVYPGASLGYGKVTALVSPVTITGNETADVVFNYNKRISIAWQAADAAAGRYQDGWWAGITVTAPAGMTEEQLEAASYKQGDAIVSFQENADGDALELWIPLNALLTDSFVPPVYQFDWNNDGLFEQTVSMQYDHTRLSLTKDGKRVYYLMGNVESLDSGNVTITGSGEEDVQVESSNLTLFHIPADAYETGMEEGWWSCLKIVAPKSVTIGADQRNDVKYRYATSIDPLTWSNMQSMYADQESAKDAAIHYMYLWTMIDPAKVENGEDIISKWAFDWDKDGRYEQTVTHTIKTENTNLLFLGTDNFYFEDATLDKKVSLTEGTYQNKAVHGEISGSTVKYSLLFEAGAPECATIDPDTGVVTLLDRGNVTIVATLYLSSGYEAMSIGFPFEIVKHTLSGFEITEPAPVTYGDNGNIFKNEAKDPTGTGTIRYQIISQESLEGEPLDETDPVAVILDETTGQLEIKRSGKVTVQAVRAEDDEFLEAVASYVLTVNRKAQTGYYVKPVANDLAYSTVPYDIEVTGYQVGDVITYAIESEDGCAELVDVDGLKKIQTNKAGSFKLIVTVSGDKCYAPQVLEREMNVATSAQNMENFFQNMGTVENGIIYIDIPYDPNNTRFTNLIVGGSGTGAVSYEVTNGSDVAHMDPENPGTLIIDKAGEVTVKGMKAGDSQYADAELYYILRIGLSTNPSFTLTEESMNIYYGVESVTLDQIFELVQAVEGVQSTVADYTLGVPENNAIGAYINAEGNLVFNATAESQTGTIPVTVTKNADDRYTSCSQVLELTVGYMDMPTYTIVDGNGNELAPNAAGWYHSDIYIQPTEGWQISATNGRDTTDWADKLHYSQESDGSEVPVFAFRNTETGGITAMTQLDGYKMDKNAPAVEITYKNPTWFEDLFGISKDTVTVTVDVADDNSGINYFYYSIDGGASANVRNNVVCNGEKTGSVSFDINAQYRNQIIVWAEDVAGNVTEYTDGKTLVVDAISPELTVKYDQSVIKVEESTQKEVYYSKNDVEMSFQIDADNFDLSAEPVVTVDGNEQTLTWTTEELINTSSMLKLTEEGDHTVIITFSDRLGRSVSYEMEVRIDRTLPVIKVEYAPEGQYSKEDRVATITVTEHNFDAGQVVAQITAKDIQGNDVPASEIAEIAEYLKSAENWTSTGDIHVAQVTFATDANYTFQLDCTDKAGNAAETYNAEAFTVDHIAPDGLTISYSDYHNVWEDLLNAITFGAYNAEKEKKLIVTLTATDVTAGVDYFQYQFTNEGSVADHSAGVQTLTAELSGTTGSASFEIPAQARGYVSYKAVDKAGNESAWKDEVSRINVVDTEDPVIKPSYSYSVLTYEDAAGIYHTGESVLVSLKINEANFDLSDEFNTMPVVTINGKVMDVTWTEDGQSSSFEIAKNAAYAIDCGTYKQYDLKVTYTDISGNDASYEKTFHIDTFTPEVTVTHAPDGQYIKENRTVTITIKDHNFDASKVAAHITAKNIKGDDVAADEVTQIAEYLKNSENWDEIDADTYKTEVTFATDARYGFTLDCQDYFGYAAETYTADAFVVDHVAPSDLKIDYSEPVTFWTELMETVTFGAYNAEKELIATVTAQDITAGVDYFEWKFVNEGEEANDEEAGNVIYPVAVYSDEDASVFSAAFDVAPEARGYVVYRAVDLAGNASEWQSESNNIKIVDTIAPQFDIEYSEGNAVERKDQDGKDDLTVYYNQDVTITLKVTEANFYSEDVKVTVTKDDVAQELTAEQITWTEDENDLYEGVFTLSDEGDYVVAVTYTDRSANEMAAYTSHRIVIDKTNPEVAVEYGLKDAQGVTVDGRTFFSEVQTATITIKEENFRADEVKLLVKAQDLLGNDIAVKELAINEDGIATVAQDAANWSEYEANWRREDDQYKLELILGTQANYTVDIEYTDLAGNALAEDYTPDLFTLDWTAPETVSIDYSTPIYEQILNQVTLGYYYNEHMTVTITASDKVSPIDAFVYSYLKAAGVSDVNKELLDAALAGAEITQNGYNFKASFTIPKEVVLGNGNQFNGTVKFDATDRAGNTSGEMQDTKFVVVDNITPTASVTYNTPAQKVGDVAYYAGNINATIVINEANFFSEDVKVSVSTNGGEAKQVNVKWVDNSADKHTGTFTLTSNGSYKVFVTYADRSKNAITPYESGKMIVDKNAPVISVTNIKHESADNSETIGFTLSVTDDNILASDIKPVLKAVVRKDDTFETVEIELPELKKSGKTYSLTVENLELDGYYTLTCQATDLSKNVSTAIGYNVNESETDSVEDLNFSVNREGSTFVIDSTHSADGSTVDDNLNGKYINGEVELVVREINVNKVGEGQKTVFTLNNGSSTEEVVLTDENYQMNKNMLGEGGWYETIYTLDNSYFTEDGVYSVNIISYDEANNSNVNTKSEKGTITFTVDRTKPVISANVTSKQVINAAQYKVHFQLTEVNLDPETVVAKLNGKVVELEVVGDNEYSFIVEAGLGHRLEITATDLAGNEADVYVASPFTVSTNFFVLWYAHTFWFWFSIIAIILMAALIILFIILKKKKKDEE